MGLILCASLYLIVRSLKSLLKGRVAVVLYKTVNGDIPDIKVGDLTIPLKWLSGYLAIGVGLLVTLAVQSSSITTSALTPLVGVGVIKIERMYPTVLGANIGTCITGVLAALAADGSKLAITLQVAYCHLFFNFSGIFVFYVIWPMRALPINAAKFLGNTTAEYKWFALAYLFMCFFLIPLIFFALSLASTVASIVIAFLFFFTGLFVVIVNTLQTRKPDVLPGVLKSWDFLPECMRSLGPMDRVLCAPLSKVCCFCCIKKEVD